MVANGNKIRFRDTTFVKYFFPTPESKSVSIAFEPCSLVSHSNLLDYLNRKSFTEEQKQLLCYMFSDGDSPNVTLDVADDKTIFESNGMVPMLISPTGKSSDRKSMYWINQKLLTKVESDHSFYNFVYYNKDSFYGISVISFSSQLKSTCFDQNTKKINNETTNALYDALSDAEAGEEAGFNLLNDISFKSNSISLSKVLMSVLSGINTRDLIEMSDFLKSEIIAKKGAEKDAKNIMELKGDLITFFYNSKNYRHCSEGTLGNSCMRGDGATEKIKFYANNPSHVSLLVYIEDKKLLARSILWEGVDGNKYTDRIYCSSSNYGAKLAAYCKSRNIKTVHYSTSCEYGIPQSEECYVKLDSFEIKGSEYPYLDSMHYVDIISYIACPSSTKLSNYLSEKGQPFLIKALSQTGPVHGTYDRSFVLFHKNNNKDLKFLRTGEGESLNGNLSGYALIKKPTLSIAPKTSIITINEKEKWDYRYCERVLIDRYNSIRPVLIYKNDRYIIRLYDKQFVTYSTFHKIHILIEDAVYIPLLNSFVLKSIVDTREFQDTLYMRKLRKMYGGKLVRISEEKLKDLKEQVKELPFKESLLDMRKSRVYNISVENILKEGVRIKGITIPYKHLRFVRK